MEYINNNLADYLASNKIERLILQNILKQIGFALMEFHFNHCISHGDINSGNILLDIDEPKVNIYSIGKNTSSINTFGYEPKFIDFQRGVFDEYMNETSIAIQTSYEIANAYDMISIWSKYDEILTIAKIVNVCKSMDDLFSVIDEISLTGDSHTNEETEFIVEKV